MSFRSDWCPNVSDIHEFSCFKEAVAKRNGLRLGMHLNFLKIPMNQTSIWPGIKYEHGKCCHTYGRMIYGSILRWLRISHPDTEVGGVESC